MSDATEQTVNAVVDAASTAITAASTLAGPYAPVVNMVVAGVRALISFAEQLGHGDAVREALDAELAAGRQKTDEALAAKAHPTKVSPSMAIAADGTILHVPAPESKL